MTSVRHMPPFSLIADTPPTATSLLPYVYAAMGTAFLGVQGFFLSRYGERLKRADARRDNAEQGNANVEIENIRSLQDLQRQRSEDNRMLRTEMAQASARSEARINLLESKVNILTAAYYQLHSVTLLLQQGWRTMRARLKRTDPTFDENEFPDLNIDRLDPTKLFNQINQPVSVSVFSSPTDPMKTTTVVTKGTPEE